MEKNIKLLVVDDNTEIRNLIRMAFKRQPKVEVFEASSGSHTVKLLLTKYMFLGGATLLVLF